MSCIYFKICTLILCRRFFNFVHRVSSILINFIFSKVTPWPDPAVNVKVRILLDGGLSVKL